MKRTGIFTKIVGVIFLAFLLIQLVPYGRNHENPPVIQEPLWDQPGTRELAKTACFDCHSNETNWPWYSHVAPVSWLVQKDVEEGRSELNFSEWKSGDNEELEEAVKEIKREKMPLPIYLITHSEADLDESQKQQLVNGLQAMAKNAISPNHSRKEAIED